MSGTRGERRRREDENEILDAALSLFVAQGFHGTSMQQIAARADFSVGKIYTLFASKDELLRRLQLRSIDELHALFGQRGLEDRPPLDELLDTLREVFAFATRLRDLIRVEVAESLGTPRGAQQTLTGLYIERARDLLDRAVARGELRPLDTRLLAIMLAGAGRALIDELAAQDGRDPYAELPERIMDLMVRPHLAGPEART
jgi:AcrR family transcriptional regulator